MKRDLTQQKVDRKREREERKRQTDRKREREGGERESVEVDTCICKPFKFFFLFSRVC